MAIFRGDRSGEGHSGSTTPGPALASVGAPLETFDQRALFGRPGRPHRRRRKRRRRPLLTDQNADSADRFGEGWVEVVSDASFSVAPGEVLAMVGESASGKSLMLMGSLNLLSAGALVIRGRTTFDGQLVQDAGTAKWRAGERKFFPELTTPEWREMVGKGIGVLFQDPVGAWDPLQRIGSQSGEVLEEHFDMTEDEIHERVLDALGEVRLPKERKFFSLPQELSRGEAQRAMLASALLAGPRLLIADEPLTGLDVTVARAILDLIEDMRRRRNMAMILVTHDLATVAAIAHRVLVVYGGRIIEEGPVTEIFRNPRHPYTAGLLGSTPWATEGRLRPIPGDTPDIADLPPGCSFAPRCQHALPRCRTGVPDRTKVDQTFVNCIRAEELDLRVSR